MPRTQVNNTDLLNANPDVRVRHFHKSSRFPRTRSITVAYREGHSTVEIATAIVNPLDTFSRKEGCKTAIEHLLAGKTTIVPKVMEWDMKDNRDKPASAAWTLQTMFG